LIGFARVCYKIALLRIGIEKMRTFLTTSVALFMALCAPAMCRACPLIAGLPDYNCDGELVISVVGDSLVYGTGDLKNDGKGGYVLRTQDALPATTIHNFGYPGITTSALTLRIHRTFRKGVRSDLAHALVKSDLVVIDVGRNDEWSKTYTETALELRKLRSEIENDVRKVAGYKPLVVTAVLMITRTIKKGAWIAELNRYISASNTGRAPADLRFDAVPWRLCGPDRIHPTSKGYKRLARSFVKYITRTYPRHVRRLRKDRDRDGLYDIFERRRFGTDPLNPDTDGDGLLDGVDPHPLNP
jgi:lysophospholipase L1-like esterase